MAACGTSGGSNLANRASSSTTTGVGSPAPVTEATLQPTTTADPPATTTVAPSTTTTTVAPTTTTTVAPTQHVTGSSTAWGWIIGAILLVVAIIAVVLALISARNRRRAEQEWQPIASAAMSEALLARDAVLAESVVPDDPSRLLAVRRQVDGATETLQRAVETAPDDVARRAATATADALRGLAFAIESERLLHDRTVAPTGEQLAQADEARRARSADLESALSRLDERIGPLADPAP